MLHPECWKHYECLKTEMNGVDTAIALADAQQDEKTTVRCTRQAIRHMRVMRNALTYFIADLEEFLKVNQDDYSPCP